MLGIARRRAGHANGLIAWLGLALLTQLLAGCAVAPSQRTAPAGFTPLDYDNRVWHEPDGQGYAVEVSTLLDQAVGQVEAVHGLSFLRSPRVLVCHAFPCFKGLVATPGTTAAVIPGEWLVLSPRLELEEHDRLPGIIAHELSHLHLGQRLGHYTARLPIWFHEGLASLVADGGGAEFSTDVATCAAWDAGRRVDFARMDTPQKRHRAADFQLSVHEFYRQSWRFMQYLRRRDAVAFSSLLGAVQAGEELTTAVINTYNAGLEQLASDFELDGRARLP